MRRSIPGQLSLFDDYASCLPTPALRPAVPQPPKHLPQDDPIFFAIMAGERTAGDLLSIAQVQRRLHGLTGSLRPARTLHISVLGVGWVREIDNGTIGIAIEAGDAVAMRRFDISFSEVVSFGRGAGPKPLVVPCDQGEAELEALTDVLRAGLRERDFIPRAPRSIRYHVTLAYDPVQVPSTLIDQPIRMPVREFALVRSIRGEGRYEPIKTWTLAV